jgi:hypothetical protein
MYFNHHHLQQCIMWECLWITSLSEICVMNFMFIDMYITAGWIVLFYIPITFIKCHNTDVTMQHWNVKPSVYIILTFRLVERHVFNRSLGILLWVHHKILVILVTRKKSFLYIIKDDQIYRNRTLIVTTALQETGTAHPSQTPGFISSF